MDLREKIQAKLKGTPEAKQRREEILGAILCTAEQGGPEAVTGAMERRLDGMKGELDEKLAALRKKL